MIVRIDFTYYYRYNTLVSIVNNLPPASHKLSVFQVAALFDSPLIDRISVYEYARLNNIKKKKKKKKKRGDGAPASV